MATAKKGAAGKVAGKALGGASASKGSKGVGVYHADGSLIREYTEAKHGKDFKALAEEFASKVEGRTVKAL